MRAVKPLLIASAISLLAILSMSPATFAHPMGNFSINHYSKIISGAHAIEVDYIIDMAEIPTFQQMQESAVVPKADDPSLVPYLQRESEALKQGLSLLADGKPLTLRTVSRQAIFPAGAGGLPTMKMGFVYIATLPGDLKDSPLLLRYRDDNYPGRAGWKEIVAVNGSGAALVNASVPADDRSLELTNYPTDMLHSPPKRLMLLSLSRLRLSVCGLAASRNSRPVRDGSRSAMLSRSVASYSRQTAKVLRAAPIPSLSVRNALIFCSWLWQLL